MEFTAERREVCGSMVCGSEIYLDAPTLWERGLSRDLSRVAT
jgi:hypothetical protein